MPVQMPAQPTTRRRATNRWRLLLAGTVLLLATTSDLVAKELAETRLAGAPVTLGPLELRLGFNPGVAFSLGDDLPSWLIKSVTATMTTALVLLLARSCRSAGPLERLGLALLSGGALGNLIDRWVDRQVTDYFHTGWWPTFNLADVWICAGVALLVLGSVAVAPREP